jgi:hypothetical protein
LGSSNQDVFHSVEKTGSSIRRLDTTRLNWTSNRCRFFLLLSPRSEYDAMSHHTTCNSLLTALVCALALVARAGAQETTTDLLEIDPKNFSRSSATVDNKWWPLKPGTRQVYDGFTVEDGEPLRHSVVATVTDLTKMIGGIRAAVLLEEDFSEGKLVEQEIAFFAQDKDGNVWHLGELVEEYDEKEFIGGKIWHFELPKGAKAGIRMWANPQVGMAASQGFAPAPFTWTDRGRVVQMGQKTKVAAGSFENVLVVEEWDQETPEGVFQTKYYAPNVGVVRIGFRGPDPQQEEMELVKTEQLDEARLAKARAKALAIEERAYMYAKTTPAERRASNPQTER